MAQQTSGNGTLIVTTVVVAILAFGGGYFVGNKTQSIDGNAPGAQGGAAAPNFGDVAQVNSPSTLADSDIIPVGNSPTMGNPNAPVTIVEFSDYQCPFCDKGAKTVKELYQKYPNDVRIVFKNYPLPFHQQAPDASRAALAAGEQGKYWEMHDKLFGNFKNFKANASDMKGYAAGFAQELGLDVEKFKRDFDKPEFGQMIEADKQLGAKIGVQGTPHFFINGVRLSGAQPIEKFEEVFKAELAEAQKVGGNQVYATQVKKNFKAAEPRQAQKPASTVQFIPVNDADAQKNHKGDYLVTVVEFSDYQCPYCKRGDDTLQEIIKNYGDKVRVVFKHLPLPMHKEAEIASRAALAAGQQGKFWEYHALLFNNQKEIRGGEPALMKWAEELGLNMDKFKKDYNDPTIIKQVKDDAALAGTVGARGTPNFFVNGVQVTGAQPFTSFKPQIDKQIEIAEKLKKEKGLKGDALYKEVVALNKKAAPAAAPARPAAPPAQVDAKLLTVGNSFTKGPDNAKVKIYEFSDFQCPYCDRGANSINEVVERYGDKVQVVFKAYPLPMHAEAEPAHRAAIAAGKQGKFWEMHDMLFSNQKAFRGADTQALFTGYASELGLNAEKFKKDFNDPAVAQQVKDEMAQGTKVGVRGTPNFIINGNRLVGAQPADKFAEIIDAELKK